MKSYLFILFIILGFSLSSCPGPVCCSDPGPDQFVGTIFTNEGHDYLKEVHEDSLNLYFFENGEKTYCNEITIETRDDTTFFGARYIEPKNELNQPISWLSADKGITEFYIELDGDVDTLNIYINANRDYERVLFNGEEAQMLNQPWRYLLQK